MLRPNRIQNRPAAWNLFYWENDGTVMSMEENVTSDGKWESWSLDLEEIFFHLRKRDISKLFDEVACSNTKLANVRWGQLTPKWNATPAFGEGLHHYDDSDKGDEGNKNLLPDRKFKTHSRKFFHLRRWLLFLDYIGNSTMEMGQEAHLRSKSSFFWISMLLLGTEMYSKLLTMHYDSNIGAVRIKVTESTRMFEMRKSRYKILYSAHSNSAKRQTPCVLEVPVM